MSARLIVVAGPPCSGKSTLSRAVARTYALRRLELDSILSRLIPESDRRESDRLIGYRAMLLSAAELLNYSHSVVLDATFTSQECRKELQNCATNSGTPVHLVQCRVAPDVAVSRFKQRIGHCATDLDERRVRKLAEHYPYAAYGLTLHSELPLQDCLLRVQAYLELSSC